MVRSILMRVILQMRALINPRHLRRGGRLKLDRGRVLLKHNILRLLLDDLIPHGIYEHLRLIVASVAFVVDLRKI